MLRPILKKQISARLTPFALAGCIASCADGAGDVLATDEWIAVSKSYASIVVDESTEVRVQLRDRNGNPLPFEARITSGNENVATAQFVAATLTDMTPETVFNIFAKDFGQTDIGVSVGSLEQRVVVQTLPGAVEVSGLPEILTSGRTVRINANALGATGTRLTTTLPVHWFPSSPSIADVDSVGTLRAGFSGIGVVQATTLVGSANGSDTVLVVPRPFTGTLNRDTLDILDTLFLKPSSNGGFLNLDEILFDSTHAALVVSGEDSIGVLVTGPIGGRVFTIKTTDPFLEETGSIEVRSEPTPNTPTTARNLVAGNLPIHLFAWSSPNNPDDYYKIEPTEVLNVEIQVIWGDRQTEIDLSVEDCTTLAPVAGVEVSGNPGFIHVTLTTPAGECRLIHLIHKTGLGVVSDIGVYSLQ